MEMCFESNDTSARSYSKTRDVDISATIFRMLSAMGSKILWPNSFKSVSEVRFFCRRSLSSTFDTLRVKSTR